MDTWRQVCTDLGTRRKVHGFERFLGHHTDSLVRRFGTKTLAWGCDRCDFRKTANATTNAARPLDFPERTCGRSAKTPDARTTA